MEHWRRLYFKGQAPLQIPKKLFAQHKFVTGQAILELAIFGSILIMLLGILINYGLRYGYQQQVMQQAFRKALASAAVSMAPHKPTTVSHVVVRDRHIPNPSDPFAVGSVMSFSSGSAGIIRSYELDETPDFEDELPQVIIDVQGTEYPFKTAGFRIEEGSYQESKARYEEIYGVGNVWRIDAAGAKIPWDDPLPESGLIRIKIIDYSAGEIMNYDTAVRQCRLIVDEDVCIDSCEEGGGKNCGTTCDQDMETPWYCLNYTLINPGTHQYRFAVLEQIFSFSRDKQKAMGLQNDYAQRDVVSNRLEKKENTADITTVDTFYGQVKTKREIVHRTYGDTTTDTERKDANSTVVQERVQGWQTPW